MRVAQLPDGTQVYHDLTESFAPIASLLLRGSRAIAALGPIYGEDPGAARLAPFRRTAEATGWSVGRDLAPEWVWDRVRDERRAAVAAQTLFDSDVDDLVDWTRAGLVLAFAQARGVRVTGRGTLHVPWRLRGTVTGRFGTDPVRGPDWTFNPLSLGPDDRWRVVPRESGRRIAVIDFRAMDLCSMVSIVPGLAARYAGSDDPHATTASILFPGSKPADLTEVRDVVKREVFVHAYGGASALRNEFLHFLPELGFLRQSPQGEAGRLVQSQSALAFRAALSRAMPLLTGDDVCPLFTVHDEVALDYSEECFDAVSGVAKALEEGASQRIGVTYRVGVTTGASYADAKSK